MNISAVLIAAAAATAVPLGPALAQTNATAPATVTWPEKTFNPKPDRDDLTLPMPCGGTMAFRKVEVQSNDGHGDRRFDIGSINKTTGISERREVYLVGPFGPSKGRYGVGPVTHYYLAKYELSEAQYDAIVAGKDPNQCPPDHSLRPKGKLNQMEARRVANLYTEWLKSARPKALSVVDPEGRSESAIVRLPTEVEWEFAARGGMAVTTAEFDRDVPDFNGTLLKDSDHFYTLESEGNRPWDIGFGQPNPLGVYNMLGNVAEVTDDAFSPVVDRRLIGLTGNPLVKGGSYRTQPVEIDLGMRSEMKTYDDQGGLAPARWIGTRFVLSAPVESSVKRIQAMADRQRAESKKTTNPKEDWVVLLNLIDSMHMSCSENQNKDEVSLHNMVVEKVNFLKNYSEFNGPMNLRFLIINGAMQVSMIENYKLIIKWVKQAKDCAANEEKDDSIKCIPKDIKYNYTKRINSYIDNVISNNKNISIAIAQDNRIQYIDDVVRDTLDDPSYYYISDYVCSPDFLPNHIIRELKACKERTK